mgnify:FL=1
MTVTVEYEAEEKLDLPYEEIIKNVIEESLDYVECPYDAEVNVLLTDNAGIHQINLDMRGIDNRQTFCRSRCAILRHRVTFPILKKHRRNTLILTQGSYSWGIS